MHLKLAILKINNDAKEIEINRAAESAARFCFKILVNTLYKNIFAF